MIAHQAALLRSIADFHDHASLGASLLAVADGLRRTLGGTRVVLGLIDGDRMRVAAVSQQASVDPGAPESRLLAAALDEARRRGAQLRADASAPPPDAPDAPDAPDGSHVAHVAHVAHAALPAHAALLTGRRDAVVVTTPLCLRERALGAVLVEGAAGTRWPAARLALLQRIADALAPMIEDRRAAERPWTARARDAARASLAALRAPRHLVPKATVAGLTIAACALAAVPLPHEVAAPAELVPLQLRAVNAPVSGYIARVAVAAGDAVVQGQTLVELDTRELELMRDRATSELANIVADLRAVRATGDRRRAAVLTARRDRADAELALAERRIARARVTAPHDGTVLSGDLARLVGAPVERGERLLELAPEGGYRVELAVDERDVDLVAVGQRGTLALQARPSARLSFELTDVRPIATATGGRTRFRVDARLQTPPSALLPGQTGVAQVRVGEASALHLLTRRLVAAARMALWQRFGT